MHLSSWVTLILLNPEWRNEVRLRSAGFSAVKINLCWICISSVVCAAVASCVNGIILSVQKVLVLVFTWKLQCELFSCGKHSRCSRCDAFHLVSNVRIQFLFIGWMGVWMTVEKCNHIKFLNSTNPDIQIQYFCSPVSYLDVWKLISTINMKR